jgi:hypothetical protein
MFGNTWGFRKIGVIHGVQSRHILQMHKRYRAADNRLLRRYPPAFISKDKQRCGKVVMRFDVGRIFWTSDEPRRAPDHANPRQCRARLIFLMSGAAGKRGQTAMNSAGDAGRGVGGGLSDE